MAQPAKAKSDTVHLFPDDEKTPVCGTQAVIGPSANDNNGAKKSHPVDLEDVEPWNLCQKCFPDKYQKYPENDHWFDIVGSAEYNGTLGSAYYAVVQCSECDFEKPVTNKSQAYGVGYEHKRHPERDL